jgi:hypothetical protein
MRLRRHAAVGLALATGLAVAGAPAEGSVFIAPPTKTTTDLGCLALVAHYSAYYGPGRTITVTGYLRGNRQFRKRIRTTVQEKSYTFGCGPAELRVGRWRLKVTGAGWNHSFRTRIVHDSD